MADEPSLSEITNIKGDADIAYGTAGVGGTDVLLPFNKGIDLLMRAAELKQQNDRWKYEQFQNNMNNYYKNFNELDVNGVMEKDYPEIMQNYSSLAKEMAENIGVIRNPNSNPEMYAMLKQKEADLRGKIAQSKQDVAYRTGNKNFLLAHPEFNTDINKKSISDFENAGRGERTLFTLQQPYTFDVKEPANFAASVAIQKSKDEAVRRGVAPDKTEEWLITQEGIEYNRQAFKDAYKDYLANQTDKSNANKSLMEVAKETWSRLTPEMKLGSFDEWLDKTSESFIPQNSYFNSMQESKYGLQGEQIAAQERMNAADNYWRWKIANLNDGTERWKFSETMKYNKGVPDEKELDNLGRAYNEAITSGFTTGFVNLNYLQNIYGDNSEVTVKAGTEVPDPSNPVGGAKTSTSVETKIPKRIVTGSTKDNNGNIVVRYVDYGTGKPVEGSETINYERARTDFYSIGGKRWATQIEDRAAKWRKNEGFTEGRPVIEELNRKFNYTTNFGGGNSTINLNATQRKNRK